MGGMGGPSCASIAMVCTHVDTRPHALVAESDISDVRARAGAYSPLQTRSRVRPHSAGELCAEIATTTGAHCDVAVANPISYGLVLAKHAICALGGHTMTGAAGSAITMNVSQQSELVLGHPVAVHVRRTYPHGDVTLHDSVSLTRTSL